MTKFSHSLVACARWEESDIVEWLEYHKSIGFDHFYIYSNDDDPNILFKRLLPYLSGDNPLVTYLHWPRVGEQIPMYLNFLEKFRMETEWACFLDIDEFIVIKNIDSIKIFMRKFENLTDCVYFNWVYYGNNGKLKRDEKSILKTLTRRSRGVDFHTKTIFRTTKVSAEGATQGNASTGLAFTHFWNNYPFPNFKISDVLGRDIANYTDNFPDTAISYVRSPGVAERIMSTAYVAHFSIKSEEDFLRRAARGGFPAQQLWKEKFERNEHLALLVALNEVEDLYLQAYWNKYTSCLVQYPIGE